MDNFVENVDKNSEIGFLSTILPFMYKKYQMNEKNHIDSSSQFYYVIQKMCKIMLFFHAIDKKTYRKMF